MPIFLEENQEIIVMILSAKKLEADLITHLSPLIFQFSFDDRTCQNGIDLPIFFGTNINHWAFTILGFHITQITNSFTCDAVTRLLRLPPVTTTFFHPPNYV